MWDQLYLDHCNNHFRNYISDQEKRRTKRVDGKRRRKRKGINQASKIKRGKRNKRKERIIKVIGVRRVIRVRTKRRVSKQ